MDIAGPWFFIKNFMDFLTGAFIPLVLLPGVLQKAVSLTPFYYILYYPASLYLGQETEKTGTALAVILFWNGVFWGLRRLQYRRMLRFYEGVGYERNNPPLPETDRNAHENEDQPGYGLQPEFLDRLCGGSAAFSLSSVELHLRLPLHRLHKRLDPAQIIVFVGTFTIVDGLGMGTWFFGIISLPEKIRTGALDMRITKPVDTQFLVSAESFNPGSFLGPVAGAFIVRYGMRAGGFSLTPGKLAGYLLLVLMMYLLMYSLSLLVMTCAFFFVKIDALIQAEESAVEFAFRIPGTAFRGAAKFVFMVLIPYGLIATVPTQFLTAGLNWGQGAAVTAITLFFVTATRLFFRFGLSRYSSAGG